MRWRESRRPPGLAASVLSWLLWLGLLVAPGAGSAQPGAGAPAAPEANDENLEETADAPRAGYPSPYAAWDAGAYDQALQGFAERQTRRPEDPELNLNVGAAHYKLNDFEAADSEFFRAATTGDDELRSEALYNLGNSAFRQGKLDDAVDFYMASLEANPDDLDAKFNLEFVREELERQQQNEGGQEQQQDQEEQEREQEGQGEQQQDQADHGGEGESSDPQQDQGDEGENEQPESRDGTPEADSDGDGIPDASDPDSQADGSGNGEQGSPRESPPGMTPEEAERYLQAVEEGRPDPTRRGQRGRRSRQAKDW